MSSTPTAPGSGPSEFDPEVFRRVLTDYQGWILWLQQQDPDLIPELELGYSIQLLRHAATTCKLAPASLGFSKLRPFTLHPSFLLTVLPDAPPNPTQPHDLYRFSSPSFPSFTVHPDDYSPTLHQRLRAGIPFSVQRLPIR